MSGILTSRQEAFCRHYSLGITATEAARRAGYAETTARDRAQRMLAHPGVQDRIAELRANEAESRAALCAQFLSQAEDIRLAALEDGRHATALRAMEFALRLIERFGLPALPSDTHDLLLDQARAEVSAANADTRRDETPEAVADPTDAPDAETARLAAPGSPAAATAESVTVGERRSGAAATEIPSSAPPPTAESVNVGERRSGAAEIETPPPAPSEPWVRVTALAWTGPGKPRSRRIARRKSATWTRFDGAVAAALREAALG